MIKNTGSSGIVKVVLGLHGLFLILLLAYFGKLLLIPLFFSFLIAMFLYPLCRWFEKHGLNRLASAMLCIIVSLLCIGLLIYFVGAQFQHFIKDIPSLKDKLDAVIYGGQTWLQQHFNIGDSTQSNYIDKSVDGLISAIGFTVTSFFSLVIFFTLSLFFIFYMLFYRKVFNDFILLFFGRANKKKILEISSEVQATTLAYVKGLLTEIIILMFLSCITLLIIGVKYAILMAFFAGMFNVIPYIGIYTAALLNMLITFVDGHGEKSIAVLLAFIVIHIIDANIITPLIVGRRIRINPLVTLMAVISGEIVWGIPGMFLFIPLAAIINIVFEKVSGVNTGHMKTVP